MIPNPVMVCKLGKLPQAALMAAFVRPSLPWSGPNAQSQMALLQKKTNVKNNARKS